MVESEEITRIDNSAPRQVVKKTTVSTTPEVKGELPQKVYEKKKTIFRFNQIIWYILGVVEVLLAFRVAFKVLAANPYVGFTSFVYAITEPLVAPFRGILGVSVSGNSVFEWSTLVAVLVYVCISWGLVYLLDLIYPITPEDVSVQ